MYGAGISLLVGISVETVVVTLGLLVGLSAGFLGGRTDTLLMRVTDVMLAFPDILLAILLLGTLGTASVSPLVSLGLVILALGLTGWPPLARLVRGQVLTLRKREFVEAARAMGADDLRIIRRTSCPTCSPRFWSPVTVDLAGVILAESTLWFLGIGIQRPYPSWGRMIRRRPGVLPFPTPSAPLPIHPALPDRPRPQLPRRRPPGRAGPPATWITQGNRTSRSATTASAHARTSAQ